MGDVPQDQLPNDDADFEQVDGARKRERSLIEFPYSDLERSVELARILHREGGQARIEQTQLAVAMDQSATGGTFRGRLGAAKMFGLIGTEMGKVWLEPLGLRAIDDGPASAAALSEAFLNIPLYSAMYERYKGYALPPPAAIERQMESLGVPPKQKERARQAFQSSATFANFIAPNGRFSQPSLAAAAPAPDETPRKEETKRGGDDGLPPDLHPFIRGLLSELPPPKSNWAIEKQRDWLNAAATMFRLIYPTNGSVEVRVSAPSDGEQ